jgi:hypothetical protein
MISFGSTCINCFSALIRLLVSEINPILGATLITCKSAIIPSAGFFASHIITLADFFHSAFNATKPSIVSGIFASFELFSISKSHLLWFQNSSLQKYTEIMLPH